MNVIVRSKTINKYEHDEKKIWVVYETHENDAPWIALYDSADRQRAFQYAKKLRKQSLTISDM